jgi:hypothetical protein
MVACPYPNIINCPPEGEAYKTWEGGGRRIKKLLFN